MKKHIRQHSKDCECLLNWPWEIFECDCDFHIKVVSNEDINQIINYIIDRPNTDYIEKKILIWLWELKDILEEVLIFENN